jgi:hypothetical protein
MDYCPFRRPFRVSWLPVRVDSICAHAGEDRAWACRDILLGLFVDVSVSHRYFLAAGLLWVVELFHQHFIHWWPRVDSDSLGDTAVDWVADFWLVLWWVHSLICWFERLISISTFTTEDLRDLLPLVFINYSGMYCHLYYIIIILFIYFVFMYLFHLVFHMHVSSCVRSEIVTLKSILLFWGVTC